MKLEIKQAMTQKELTEVFRIRTQVFVGEQHVPADEEIDQLDEVTPLFVVYLDDVAVATARLIQVNESIMKIGRVAVLKPYRNSGVGKTLLRYLMTYVQEQTEATCVKLGAQCNAMPFYEKLGFIGYGPIYLDAGIEHQDMKCEWERTSK